MNIRWIRKPQQLNGLVFYPVKTGLEKLHRNVAAQDRLPDRIDIAPARHGTSELSSRSSIPQEQDIDDYTVSEQATQEAPPQEPVFRKDVYRESLEDDED